MRRAAARPKPNILGRGAASRNREIKPEANADSKPLETEKKVLELEAKKHVADEVMKAKLDDALVKEVYPAPKADETEEPTEEPPCMINIIPDEEHEEKQDKEKEISNKIAKPPVPRFRSRFARARPNVEAVSRPRIR